MTKARMLVGLTAMLGVFAISVTPALAEFQSLNGTSQGNSQLVTGTSAVFTAAPGGIPLSCQEAPDQWKLRKNDAKQEPQLKGGHLTLQTKFQTCHAKILMLEIKIPNVTCELEIVQVPGSGTAGTGQVLTECLVKVPVNGCEIKVPALSGTKNSELKEISLENVEKETNLEQKVNAKGITNIINKGCEMDGITNNGTELKGGGKEGTEATFKLEGIEHGLRSDAT